MDAGSFKHTFEMLDQYISPCAKMFWIYYRNIKPPQISGCTGQKALQACEY